MPLNIPQGNGPAGSPPRVADSATAMASPSGMVSLQRVDEAAAVQTPAAIADGTWMEQGFDALAAEQLSLWPAHGKVSQRPKAAAAESLHEAAKAEMTLLDHGSSLLASAKENFDHCRTTLQPWVQRGPHAKFRYWTGWAVLGLGDAVGVAGAAILLGEEIWIAAGLACATGVAAVTAGLVGNDLKERHLARQRRRDPEDLSDDEKRYKRFFLGADDDGKVLKTVGRIAGAVVCLLVLGIFALRASIEGPLAGLVFGGLAGATALASVINSYAYADEVADLIGVYDKSYRQEQKALRKTAKTQALRQHATALEEAASIEEEHQHRAQAAAAHLQALKFHSLTGNPRVVGHGPGPRPATVKTPKDDAAKPAGPVSRHRRRTTSATEAGQ
ncbi:hypothetical protein [Arthrobacter sp. KNU40]|uniref:hypothetical protein n=1 Tax=Arthrobacter sp. KNU40 TaxID=3447965 RepID=UPI003F6223C5